MTEMDCEIAAAAPSTVYGYAVIVCLCMDLKYMAHTDLISMQLPCTWLRLIFLCKVVINSFKLESRLFLILIFGNKSITSSLGTKKKCYNGRL